LGAMLAVVACFGVGCNSDDESPEVTQPVVRNIPKAKPRPKAKTIAELQTKLSIDDRIYMAEENAPRDEVARVAILQFFNAMLHTDVSTLQSMLSLNDQTELLAMMDSGLESYMQNISLVQLQTGVSPEGRSCVLAIFEVGLDYQVQVWFYQNNASVFSFESGPIRPNLVDKLSGIWITNYFDQRERQTEIANQADADTTYTLAGETITSGDSDPRSPGGPRGPIGPGGPSGPGK